MINSLKKNFKNSILKARNLLPSTKETPKRTKPKDNLSIKYESTGKIVKGRKSPYSKNVEVYNDGTVVKNNKDNIMKVSKFSEKNRSIV